MVSPVAGSTTANVSPESASTQAAVDVGLALQEVDLRRHVNASLISAQVATVATFVIA